MQASSSFHPGAPETSVPTTDHVDIIAKPVGLRPLGLEDDCDTVEQLERLYHGLMAEIAANELHIQRLEDVMAALRELSRSSRDIGIVHLISMYKRERDLIAIGLPLKEMRATRIGQELGFN